jgi:hypothetical protein
LNNRRLVYPLVPLVILALLFGTYVDLATQSNSSIHTTLTSKSSTSCAPYAYSDYRTSIWSFSFQLNTGCIVEGYSNVVVEENLTNVSGQTQTFAGAENAIPQYTLLYPNNDSVACSFFDGDYSVYNYSVAPSQTLSLSNLALPSYSYSTRPTCTGIASIASGTYILQIFSAWGSGQGASISPLTSANLTVTITNVQQTSTSTVTVSSADTSSGS